jgi:hypothetical protein
VRRAALGLCLLGLIAWPAAAAAQGTSPPAPSGAMESLEVPGGTAALAQLLDLGADAPRDRLMLTAIRVMVGGDEGQDPLRNRQRAQAARYLEALAAFERARAALGPAPITLAGAADKNRRKAVRLLADALGALLVEDRKRWRLEPVDGPVEARARAWLDAAGVGTAGLLSRLNAGAGVTLDRRADTVPLPLPAAVWGRVLKTTAPLQGSLLTAILGERRAALLYLGAAALDRSTRAFLAASPSVVGELYDDLPSAAFAFCGRSVRVEGNRILVPGGEAAAPLWEALVGTSPASAADFIPRLMSRDDGRVALLYDAVAHLEPAAQAFVLGLDVADPAVRKERFRKLADAAAVPLVGWNPRYRPVERVLFDVPHLLMRMRMTASRRPAGPLFASFWDAAFASPEVPARDDGVLTKVAGGPELDAAGLMEQIAVANTAVRRDRAEAWMFAQRVFPAPDAAALPDVLVALRGFVRYRALSLTLERMGITAPATYAAAARTAVELSRADGGRAWTLLAEFQGALAILERARFARAIDVPVADRLVRALCAVPFAGDREYLGAVAGWIERDLRPSFGAVTTTPLAADPDRPIETHVLAITAGAVQTSPFGDVARMPTAEWEGLLYRIDPATAVLRRLLEVRRRQGGVSLDAALALARAAEAVLTMKDPGGVAAHVADLTAAVAAVTAMSPLPDDPAAAGMPKLDEALADARDRLKDLKRQPDAHDLARAVRDLRRAAEWHLGRVLASIAYAPHVGDPDSPALLGGDPSRLHDFGLADPREDPRLRTTWSVPQEGRDPKLGWKVTGSLLALDVGLARFALRRVASEVMPSPPMLTDVERRAVTEPVVLLSPFDQTDESRDALVAALRRGRSRVAEAAATADQLVRLAAEAGIDEWRMQLMNWMHAAEPARVTDEWSLGELVRIGADGQLPAADGWGVSGLSADGNLFCEFPVRFPWTTLAGRKGSRLVVGMVPDLMIGVADALGGLHVPARLAVGVLSVAAQDLLDALRTNHDDDWLTLASRSRTVMTGRIEDYVAALTIGGPLVPADDRDGAAPLRR